MNLWMTTKCTNSITRNEAPSPTPSWRYSHVFIKACKFPSEDALNFFSNFLQIDVLPSYLKLVTVESTSWHHRPKEEQGHELGLTFGTRMNIEEQYIVQYTIWWSGAYSSAHFAGQRLMPSTKHSLQIWLFRVEHSILQTIRIYMNIDLNLTKTT